MSRRRVSVKDLGQVDCEGWLLRRKEGRRFLGSKWKRYWFVLKKSSLYWYSDKMAQKAEGFINLCGFTIEPAKQCRKKHAITATHPLVVTIFIAAESFTDMNKWISKMSEAAEQSDLINTEECYSEDSDQDGDESLSTSSNTEQETADSENGDAPPPLGESSPCSTPPSGDSRRRSTSEVGGLSRDRRRRRGRTSEGEERLSCPDLSGADGAPPHLLSGPDGAPPHLLSGPDGAPPHLLSGPDGAPPHLLSGPDGAAGGAPSGGAPSGGAPSGGAPVPLLLVGGEPQEVVHSKHLLTTTSANHSHQEKLPDEMESLYKHLKAASLSPIGQSSQRDFRASFIRRCQNDKINEKLHLQRILSSTLKAKESELQAVEQILNDPALAASTYRKWRLSNLDLLQEIAQHTQAAGGAAERGQQDPIRDLL